MMKTQQLLSRSMGILCSTGLAIGAFLIINSGIESEAAPPPPTEKPAALEVLKVVEGKVVELTRNKPGDVDGWKLSNGSTIHFPPHVGKELEKTIEVGATVRVLAKKKLHPDGSEVQEAITIENGEIAFFVAPPASKPPHDPQPSPHAEAHAASHPGHAAPPKPRDEIPMTATGKVREFHENKGGDVDGFLLGEEATEVRFPPHLSQQVQSVVRVGESIVVHGRRHETPKGDNHLHADKITAGDKTISIDRPTPKHEGPKHEAGPEHGGPLEEIMRELREIRRMIKSLKS